MGILNQAFGSFLISKEKSFIPTVFQKKEKKNEMLNVDAILFYGQKPRTRQTKYKSQLCKMHTHVA